MTPPNRSVHSPTTAVPDVSPSVSHTTPSAGSDGLRYASRLDLLSGEGALDVLLRGLILAAQATAAGGVCFVLIALRASATRPGLDPPALSRSLALIAAGSTTEMESTRAEPSRNDILYQSPRSPSNSPPRTT